MRADDVPSMEQVWRALIAQLLMVVALGIVVIGLAAVLR